MTNQRNITAIYTAYMEAWLWAEGDDEDRVIVIDDCMMDQAYRDILAFVRNIAPLDTSPWTDEALGHDLLLTRNGHGTGFWDRGHGDIGETLTDLAVGMGEGS